jgi:hypothetical protein
MNKLPLPQYVEALRKLLTEEQSKNKQLEKENKHLKGEVERLKHFRYRTEDFNDEDESSMIW